MTTALLKAERIREARKAFSPGERQPCEVCGKYRSLTHAHHVVPLSVQTDVVPDHASVWLCPTHHAAVHLFIEQATCNRERAGRWQVELINELEVEEFDKVWAIFERFRSRP